MLLVRIPSKMKFFLRIVSIRDVFIVLQIGGFFFFFTPNLVLQRNVRKC